MGATSGAGTAYSSVALEVTPDFRWGSCYSIFSFMCMFCISLFVLLSFFFRSLCCLFWLPLWYVQTLHIFTGMLCLLVALTAVVLCNSYPYHGTTEYVCKDDEASVHYSHQRSMSPYMISVKQQNTHNLFGKSIQ